MNPNVGSRWGTPPAIEAPIWWANLVVALLALAFLFEFAYGAWLVRRRDEDAKLYWLVLLGACTVFPYYVEPWIDVMGATTYMTNYLPYITVADRPLPIFVLGVWGGGTALVTVGSYKLIKRGAPGWLLVAITLGFGIPECVGEMLNVHFGLMRYFDNNALVFGVPLPSIPQNGGWFVLSGWAFAAIVPHLRGWRWALVPFISPAVYLAYTVICTSPSYYAIHTGLGPAPSWALAALSASLNLLAVVAAAHSPTAQRYRDEAAARRAAGRQQAPRRDLAPAL